MLPPEVIVLPSVVTLLSLFPYENLSLSSVSVYCVQNTGNLGPLKGAELDPLGHVEELVAEHLAEHAKGGWS